MRNLFHCKTVRLDRLDLQEIAVQLHRNELIYDLHFATNRIARLSFVDDEGRLKKISSSAQTDDDANADFIDRLFTSAVADVKAQTVWASGLQGGRMVTDDVPEDIEEWNFIFRLPLDWRGQASVLASFIHNYVVFYAASQWLSLCGLLQQSQAFAAQASQAMSDLVYELRKQSPSAGPRFTDLFN